MSQMRVWLIPLSMFAWSFMASAAAPVGWTCPQSYYGEEDISLFCDCGCGVADPNCADATLQSCAINNCEVPNVPSALDPVTCVANVCADGVQIEMEPCDDGNMSTGDGCTATCTVEEGYDCALSSFSLASVCLLLPPQEWLCLASWYGTGDGCDCGCGIVDPDCSENPAPSCSVPGCVATACEFCWVGSDEEATGDCDELTVEGDADGDGDVEGAIDGSSPLEGESPSDDGGAGSAEGAVSVDPPDDSCSQTSLPNWAMMTILVLVAGRQRQLAQ